MGSPSALQICCSNRMRNRCRNSNKNENFVAQARRAGFWHRSGWLGTKAQSQNEDRMAVAFSHEILICVRVGSECCLLFPSEALFGLLC